MSLAYRLRLFSLDRWNLWPRLTRYRTWAGPEGETLDGTNNACERARGALWAGWVKERYRSMPGYKRPQSVLNVRVASSRPWVTPWTAPASLWPRSSAKWHGGPGSTARQPS